MSTSLKAASLFDFSHTIVGDILEKTTYPYEILSSLGELITALGESLDPTAFRRVGNDVWVAKSAAVADSAHVTGPAIIGEGAEVRHGAFVRGKVIVGRGAVVGNSTELKNAVLFDGVQAPHYNYIGDSILGYKAHLGAGAICSNIKSDRQNVVIRTASGEVIETGLRKLGALVGDFVEVGCGCVLNPGTVIGKHSTVYPLLAVRGEILPHRIFKNGEQVIKRPAER